MKVNRILAMAVAALLLLTVLVGCGASQQTVAKGPSIKGPTVEKIKARTKLLVGVKHDVPKFGFRDPETNKVDGYEIDLIRHIAKEIFGNENAFETQHVTPKNRIQLLNDGEVDLVVATMTITEQRKLEVDFSPVYYTDGIGLLVLKSSNLKGLEDMSGGKLGVVKNASTGPRMLDKAKDLEVNLAMVEFDSYPEIKKALLAGTVDAMSTDGAILAGYVDSQTVMLPKRYTQEPYGIATKKGNDDLRQLVEQLILDMEKSGELQKLQDKWGIRVGS